MALANLKKEPADEAIASALRTLGAERDGLGTLMEAIGDGLPRRVGLRIRKSHAPGLSTRPGRRRLRQL